MKINYTFDKETKNTVKFVPKSDREDLSGSALYLHKNIVAENGIDPAKGFSMTIEAIK